MEELQDAIEDAQYITAIATLDDGPRPVLPWEIPSEADLAKWKKKVLAGDDLRGSAIQRRSSGGQGGGGGGENNVPEPFEFEWTLAHALGFFLFSSYLKSDAVKDHVGINFMEEVIRWKNTRGRFRAEKTSFIVANYLTPLTPEEAEKVTEVAEARKRIAEEVAKAAAAAAAAPPPPTEPDGGGGGEKAEEEPKKIAPAAPPPPEPVGPPVSKINEWDLRRKPASFSKGDAEKLRESSAEPTANYAGVGGPVLESILSAVDKLRKVPGYEKLPEMAEDEEEDEEELDLEAMDSEQAAMHMLMSNRNMIDSGIIDPPKKKKPQLSEGEKLFREKSMRSMSLISNDLPNNLFDEAELVVAESIRERHWAGFQKSEHHTKLLNFLWFQDKPVVEEDFFLMRVLGRGGFGLVTACKKGTSGKLYAMKVQNKKRIKLKKAEQLTLNEQKCLADINSPFVVNLKYSFQSNTDVFLILDLMTGGDLSYHLSTRGRFPKKECLYYAARIMLGLQALHDKGYVYRDLKPENCLMGEDGRVKLTDLGLATKVTPKLHGAAGTRGYWAPEMLRRDENGKRKNYTHMVDWFSYGCTLAEFISGTNPFRSETALNFGLEKGKKTKEKAIDCATLEMQPKFESSRYDTSAADLCRRLLDKNVSTRLGVNGAKEIMSHSYFREVNWEEIISDVKRPPFIPPKDVNAASQSEIGTFAEDKKFHETVLSEKDEAIYKGWAFTNSNAFAAEVIEFLIYERETGKPLLPIDANTSCCCTII